MRGGGAGSGLGGSGGWGRSGIGVGEVGVVGGGHQVGGQGGCKWRTKVFVKIKKKKIFLRGGGAGGSGLGGSGGWGGGGGGGRGGGDQKLGWGRWG